MQPGVEREHFQRSQCARRRARRWLIPAVVVGMCCCARSLHAQVVTGTITGVVSDESRAVLPKATITATSPALPGGPVTTITNAQGAYRLSTLPPGVYQMEVSLPGFARYVEKDLWVTVGGTIERNVTLGVSTVAETITVSGATPLVDSRQTGVAGSLGREAVEALPTARQGVTAYLGTFPGVALGNYNSGTNPVIMGSNSTDSSYMVDGMLTNHPSNGLAWAFYDMDAAEEINLVSLGASTEYQQAQGGVMNYVSKAGTNVYRGDGSIYWAPPEPDEPSRDAAMQLSPGRHGFQAVQVPRLCRSRRWAHREEPTLVLRRPEQQRPGHSVPRPARSTRGPAMGQERSAEHGEGDVEDQRQDAVPAEPLLRMVELEDP